MQRKWVGVLLIGLVMIFTGGVVQAGNVTFQVNMNEQANLGNFTPDTDIVTIRGDFNEWSGSEPQLTDTDEDGIYDVTFFLETGDHYYKFVTITAEGAVTWEDIPDDRFLTVVEGDMIVEPVWFSNVPGGSETINGEVFFQVDMTAMIQSGNFNPDNDIVIVRGGHPVLGNWVGEDAVLSDLGENVFGNTFEMANITVGVAVEYKFVVIPENNPENAIWESRENRGFTFVGDEPDTDENGYHELALELVNFNDQSAEDFTTVDLNVIFEVDMRPAFYKMDDPNSGGIPGVESINSVEIAGDFNAWPWNHFTPDFMLHDDGVAPDEVAGDSIYTIQLQFNAGSPFTQIYKYAINGQDVETGFGENHVLVLDEGTNPNFTHDNFGEPGNMYDPWIYWILPLRNYDVQFLVDMRSFIDSGIASLDTMTVGVRGGVPELGNWAATTALAQIEGSLYGGWIEIDNQRPGNDIEFKFVVQGENSIFWEADPNRLFSFQGEEVDDDEDGLLEVYLETANFNFVEPPISISEIQYVADPATDDASPFVGQTVTVEGWVTFDPASGSRTRFFMADAPGPWNGIYVYSPNGTPRMGCGWYVRVTGEIQEYFGLTELAVADVNDIQVLYTGIYWGDPPAATEYTVVSAADLQDPSTAEQYESVLIRVENVVTTAEPGEFGEWSVADASGNSLVVDNPMNADYGYIHAVKMGEPFDYVQGPLNYSYSEYKILPEIAHDLNVAVDVENGWFDSVPYIQQVKWHDIVVHRNEGVDEYRYDQSYASDTRYNNYDMSELVKVKGVVTLEPGVGHAGTDATKFIIADAFVGVDENNELLPWSSVVVYAQDATVVPELALGDVVTVEGYVSEYTSGPSHLTEIMLSPAPGTVQVVGHWEESPLPRLVELATLWDYWESERNEGVIVHTGGGVVTDNSNENIKQLFLVDDESDEMPAVQITGDCAEFRNENYVRPSVGTNILSITGWVENNYGMLTPQTEYDNIFRLNPRYLGDVNIEGGGGEQHFYPVAETGISYAIVVASAAYGEGSLMPGDEIAVFDGDLCVGAEIITDYPVSITAWQGDAGQGLEGFTIGHNITYKVWVAGEQMEYSANATYITGDGTFGSGFGSNVDLDVQQFVSVFEDIAGGRYELISTPVVAEDMSTPSFFDNWMDLQIVYADDGNFYWPSLSVDNIGEVDFTEGYRVFVSTDQTVEMVGMPVDHSTEFELFASRWNWMGYPFIEERSVSTVLSDILNQVIIIQNDEGEIYWPMASVYELDTFVPGVGYQIFVTDDVTFTFNDQAPAKAAAMPKTQIVALPDAPKSTGLPFPVLVNWDEDLDAMGVAAVELYAGDLMVGKGAPLAERQAAYVTAWGGDAEHDLPGFENGQAIKVRLIGEDGSELPLKSETAGSKYGEGAGAIISVEATELPSEFMVSAGYPNPFNPSITIPFGLPAGGEVHFTLFNILGQRILSESQHMQAGYHRHVFQARPGMVSGVYFLKVDFEGATKMQKIMLLK